jgi:hypothetical protein
MKHKVYKLFINYEKEEKWLNEMAAKGLHLVDYTVGRYLFEEGPPGEYIYRLELLKSSPTNAEGRAYINFMEESGVECIATYFRWVFFRKKASEGPFDLYSDHDSKIKHYKNVASLVGVVGGFNLFAAVLNTYLGLSNGYAYGNYTNAYFSMVNWILVFLIAPMLVSYLFRIKKLKKEKLLFE